MNSLYVQADEEALFAQVFGRSPRPVRRDVDRALVETLATEGWVVIENALARDHAAQVRAALVALCGPVGRNAFEGARTQRVYSLLAKTRATDALVEHAAVRGLVDAFLDNALLSAGVVVHLHPGEVAQPWHCDGEYFGVPRPRAPIGVSTVWALEDFTADNGATELVARSHVWGDRRLIVDGGTPASHPVGGVDAPSIRAVMPAGSVLVFFDTLFHRAGANHSESARCGVTIQYCQGWARGVENMALAIPRDTVAELSPRIQDLVGYSIHHAFVGYVDGRHPRKLLRGHREG
jgi:ectoine hydroxylase-related dioxygenase (phytanoyl-CoA dioxygenase family)